MPDDPRAMAHQAKAHPGSVRPLVQATCLLIGAGAVLIRGEPGSGKSALAADLIDRCDETTFIRLVGDDAIHVQAAGGRLVAFAPEPTRGLIEMRGIGLRPVPFEPRAVVRLVVDLVPADAVERLPEEPAPITEIAGIRLPGARLPRQDPANARRVLALIGARGTAA